jgi:quercetin dioxygenase-like cupin family protein
MIRTTVHLTLVSAGVAAMIAGAYAQKPVPGQALKDAPKDAASNFTGKAAFVDAAEMRTSRIRFEAGARTHWHTHSATQLLLIEEGKGRVQEAGSAPRELLVGQPFLTKANVSHWHGAAPDSHAIQLTTYTGTLQWEGAVTDDQYSGKARK